MKLSLNLLLALYCLTWILAVSVFDNFQLINIAFLSVTILAIVLICTNDKLKNLLIG